MTMKTMKTKLDFCHLCTISTSKIRKNLFCFFLAFFSEICYNKQDFARL